MVALQTIAVDSIVPPANFASASVVRGAEVVASPWKNGGGLTREIAVHPPGAGFDHFVWRVSVADIESSGPFSRFSGVDRTLVLLSGAGMLLADERGMAQTALSEPFAFARFAGELVVNAELLDGPTRDFNLMVRRSEASGTVELWRGGDEHRLDADAALVFCAEGTVDLTVAGAEPVRLAAMDTLHLDRPRGASCIVSGEGTALAVGIRYFDRQVEES
jgi:environmental stress-induced protein Ves